MTQATSASYNPSITAAELTVSAMAAEQLAGLMANPDWMRMVFGCLFPVADAAA